MSNNNDVPTYKLIPNQMEFFTATEREVLLSGGFGSGKSLALCLKLIQQASIKGNICLLVRKYLSVLRKSTLRMLLETEGNRPPLLPPNSYTHNKVERLIELHGGGTIIYSGCDDVNSIRSINCGDVFVDEASELNEQEYLELIFRLRVDVGGLRIHSCTNPAGKNHFLYRRFETERGKDRKIIYANSLENRYLPKNNLEWLDQLSGDARSKFVEGRWADSEKLVYSNFNVSSNVTEELPVFKHYIVGIDYGYSNPTCILLCGVDGDDRVFAIKEIYKSKMLIAKIIEEIMGLVAVIGKSDYQVVVDPSAAGLIAELDNRGLPAVKADNDVQVGCDRVRDRIDSQRLMIHPDCVNLIKEIAAYSFDDLGKVVKMYDHSVDALRYVSNHLSNSLSDGSGKVYVF